VNGELGRMWKKADVVELEVLSWHFPGQTKEKRERSQLG
jgi:hypothetical protein